MKLELIIQSEVSQKEKHQYSILTKYMEFRKMRMITLRAQQQKRHRCPLNFPPWKKSYDKPRQCIKKQKHHFANQGLYSQSYGFSSSQV